MWLRTSLYLRFIAAAGLPLLTACTSEKATALLRLPGKETRDLETARRLESDPLGFLKDLYARSDALQQYRVNFHIQERLGFFPRLRTLDQIRVAFRKQPFSVKFEWDDPATDFYESVYVAGQHQDKLLVRERRGFLGFPPQVRMVNVVDPVLWGKSKNPITDFGLAGLVHRTLLPVEDPELAPLVKMKYEGIVSLNPQNRPAYHLRIEHPPTPRFPYARHDFYIDTETLLPAGTDLWLPNGLLDARYRYTDLDANVQLKDADFRLSSGHPATQPDSGRLR